MEASGLRVPVSGNTSMSHSAKPTGAIHPMSTLRGYGELLSSL